MKSILILALLVFSCSSPEVESSQPESVEKTVEVPKSVGTIEFPQEESGVPYNFQHDPKAVVQEVFNAANTKDYSKLALLVDPAGQSDEPSINICNVGKATPERELEFIEYFKLGKVVGEPILNGNTAEVQIKFGPDGTKDETFVLVLRSGLWYLGSI